MPKTDTAFLTHDNGGLSFLVEVLPQSVNISKVGDLSEKEFLNTDHDTIKSNAKKFFDTGVLSIRSYLAVFKSEMPKWAQANDYVFEPGNSVLVHLYSSQNEHHYVYIGELIKSFVIKDKILRYFSPIGNSDVPYSYAIGETNTYLMTADVYIPNEEIYPNLTESNVQSVNPYWYFYNLNKKTEKLYRRKYKLRSKTIVKRLF